VSPWKVILATMVIFVCGVVTGALVIKTQGWRPASPAGAGRIYSIGPPGRAPVDDVVRRLKVSLDLTTNQCDKIARIMQDSQATNAAIRKGIAPLLQKEVDRAHQAITNFLTPEQQIKYAELLKEQDQRPGGRGEGLREGRGPRGGEAGRFRQNTNRFPTNGPPEAGRGRMGRRGQNNNLLTNGPGSTNFVPTNGLPADATGKLDGSSPSNNPSTNGP
jgi:Spy/CpxP family protein refolding chaperone